MSTRTAAENAEKRRITLEKLRTYQSKHARNSATTNSFKTTPDALKKRSELFPYQRGNARTVGHPYQRPNRFQPSTTRAQQPNNARTSTSSVTCKPYMISPTTFAVESSRYHDQLVKVFRTIPSKFYDTNTRIWSFAIKYYQLVKDRVGALKLDVVIGSIPKQVLDLCTAPVKQLDPSCLASIETKLADKLMPFQREGVCIAIAHSGCFMICDEMGLGKTHQALAVADFYKKNWPLLICTTASNMESWRSHIRELLPSLPDHCVQVLSSSDQYSSDAKILIASYTMLGILIDKLVQHKFGVLIFDESHSLKNAKTKCSKAADRLARMATNVILLSGTPALSRPLELFTQMQLVDRKFMSFMEFTTRYCDGKQTQFGWDAKGQSNSQELEVVLKLKFMIRRIKADVLPQLVDKNREIVNLDPALLRTNDDDFRTTLNKFDEDFRASKGKQREKILLQFYAQTAVVKAQAVCSYLKSVVEENVKFIVFAHHHVMLDSISDCLDELRVNYIRIDGKVKNATRAEYIERFQSKSDCKVAVLSLGACNSGITLTAAEMIIFAELDWNPTTLMQAESRAHRIGQDREVKCRYLMASSTADDIIWNILKKKQNRLSEAGLFSEDLRDATHFEAPTTSKKIKPNFSTDKGRQPIKEQTETPIEEGVKTEFIDKPQSKKEISQEINTELENNDELFDDDDDVFNDTIC